MITKTHNLVRNRKLIRNTGIEIPPVIFGTSGFGNLYQEMSHGTKTAIIEQMLKHVPQAIVLDSAGKYGAGLALESIGQILGSLGVSKDRVLISNKLGWRRVPLEGGQPTFEPGVWVGLQNDAVQDIGYDGIIRCWEQGNQFLNGFQAQLVSVHDPDEYLAAAATDQERDSRWKDIIDAYRALADLRDNGMARAIGVGSKDWRVARRLIEQCDLDWVMLANSYTIYRHEPELMEFLDQLAERNVVVINSAIFHGGFLVGGEYFDYQTLDPANEQHAETIRWRDRFVELCDKYKVLPAQACAAFAVSHPGIASIALNTSRPDYIARNLQLPTIRIDNQFWLEMKSEGLLQKDYRHLGVS